jgi:2-keto-4-pentenoate hydratase/2-oxohepta-3-ene-1,7-dioic acid hydratase in catechol pathway
VRFQTQSDETWCGYLAGTSVIEIGERHPHQALGALPRALGPERPVHDRREVTLLPPVDPGTVVRLDGCYAHDTIDPHLSDLESRETPSLWVAPTDSLAADGTEVALPAMTEDVQPGVELGLVVGEQASEAASDCCLLSEYYEQCAEADS